MEINSADRFIVIGSGPSAVAVCAVLIKHKIRPLVIDAAIDLGSGEETAYEFKNNKTWFGSARPYKKHDLSRAVFEPGLSFRANYTKGGFSRVWGATFSFFEDYTKWPADCIPSTHDFELVEELLKPAITFFDSNPPTNTLLGDSRSGALLESAQKRLPYVSNASRLAVEVDKTQQNHCNYRGHCLTGCPQDAIWFAGNQIDSWKSENKLDYISGIFVQKILAANKIQIVCSCCESKAPIELEARRVFVCSGVISSTEIAVNSGMIENAEIQDTATVFMGAIATKTQKRSLQKSHTLSQWKIKHPKLKFSAQMYSPHTSNLERLSEYLPKWFRKMRVVEVLNSRLHPIIFYFNSQDSEQIYIERATQSIRISVERNFLKRLKLSISLVSFSIQLLKIGLIIPTPFVRIPKAGSGFHSGGSLAHGVVTDSLGCFSSYKNVHFVDAASLPSIEVGSITPTIMANACRITRMIVEIENQ
jgi:hypothetical protein